MIIPPPVLQIALIYLARVESSNPFLAFKPTIGENRGFKFLIEKSLKKISEQPTHGLF